MKEVQSLKDKLRQVKTLKKLPPLEEGAIAGAGLDKCNTVHFFTLLLHVLLLPNSISAFSLTT
jgi:hypothetical protein